VIATLSIERPNCLTLQGKSRAELEQGSAFFPALKYFKLGEIPSGQAALMAGMGGAPFLNGSHRSGVAVIEMDVASKWLAQAPWCSVPKRFCQ
jgi:hypothetical protein